MLRKRVRVYFLVYVLLAMRGSGPMPSHFPVAPAFTSHFPFHFMPSKKHLNLQQLLNSTQVSVPPERPRVCIYLLSDGSIGTQPAFRSLKYKLAGAGTLLFFLDKHKLLFIPARIASSTRRRSCRVRPGR